MDLICNFPKVGADFSSLNEESESNWIQKWKRQRMGVNCIQVRPMRIWFDLHHSFCSNKWISTQIQHAYKVTKMAFLAACITDRGYQCIQHSKFETTIILQVLWLAAKQPIFHLWVSTNWPKFVIALIADAQIIGITAIRDCLAVCDKPANFHKDMIEFFKSEGAPHLARLLEIDSEVREILRKRW